MKAILERHGLMALLLAIFVFAAHGAWLLKVRLTSDGDERSELAEIVAW
jgi:hypothetical protein